MPIPSIAACKHIHTRLGPMLLAATEAGLAGAWFEGQRHHPDTAAWPRDGWTTRRQHRAAPQPGGGQEMSTHTPPRRLSLIHI